MSEPIKKHVTVLAAEYSKEAKSIVLLVECDNGRFYSHIHLQQLLPNITNWDYFRECDVIKLSKGFCKDIVGKKIWVVFDPDLDAKIKDNHPIEYNLSQFGDLANF